MCNIDLEAYIASFNSYYSFELHKRVTNLSLVNLNEVKYRDSNTGPR